MWLLVALNGAVAIPSCDVIFFQASGDGGPVGSLEYPYHPLRELLSLIYTSCQTTCDYGGCTL